MDGNNWRPAAQGESNGMDGGDWRALLSPDARQKIVNKIMETLKKHLPISGPEGLVELQKIAVRFEEKIYTAATSQSDYLRKISMKMLTMENKSQPASATNPLPSNSAGGNQNPSDPALHGMQSQVRNQGQPLSMPLSNQSQSRQQLLSQNLPNTTTQSSAGLPPALSSMAGITQNAISNIVGQGSNLQNMSGIAQNSVSNSVGQGVQSNMFANSQRQMQGRPQQVVPQQHQQQSQGPQNLIYQQQLQHQLLKQKMQQGNIQSNLLPSHMQQQQQQQQQQSLLQPNQMLPSQQSLMQISSSGLTSSQPTQQTQPSLMQPTQPGLQQNQQSSVQQSGPSVLQQQSVLRQQQQASITQQSILPSQQQQQLTGQQPSSGNMQQNQILGQQNSISDISQQQQQRLLGQQNNLSNMQQQQQSLMGQQNSIASLHQQQQQLGPQSNVSALQQQQQQQLLGPGLSNMQQHQHSMHMMQHSKVSAQQQQAQQTSSTLLPSQVQQSQSQPPQQQLMSQLQSQPAQLQQQLQLQQQPNSLQREMQQRMQTPGSLLPPQNAIEQQKQMFQSQRGLPEAPSSSMDSTSQTGHTGVVDWQEEIYQKIKSMKELYFPELNEMYQKINIKFQQHDALVQQSKQPDHTERLRYFKNLLERMIAFLQLPKSNIPIGFKDKLPQYEKQIIGLLSSHRLKKPGMPQQQGQQQSLQQASGQSHSMTQQLQSQIPQLQQHDNHVNQMQQMNLQPSMTSMQPSATTGLQHGSMPLSTHLGVPTTQQSMMNALQSNSNLESTSGNAMSGMIGSLQQNTVNAAQQANINTLSQSGPSSLQPNMNPLQQNSNMLQHQHLKQEQLMQTQQLKQQYQQRQMQQQLMQQQKQQQLQQQQQQQHQQQQQQQQQKPQHSVQLQPHQMPQLHQMSEANELKVRPGTGLKPVMFPQHHPSGQRPTYHHQQQQQLKMGAPFPISSPQFFQPQSPQISQHSSPQIDQQSLLTSIPKSATPMQSANSPFIVPPSPSTPLAPSPLQGDPEKQQSSGISSISNAGNMGHQQTAIGPTQAQSLAIGTPGISASPLLAEFSSPDGNQGSAPTALSGKSSATERPLEHLIKVVKSTSPNALSSSVSDIGSVVSMVDRIAGSAPGNGSRAAVGEDLVAMTKCRLQARNFMSQDGSAATKKMRRQTSAMPLNVVLSAGSVNDSFKQLDSLETSELESAATFRIKRHKVEASHALLEEIREINQRLIDTVVEISDEDVDLIAADGEGAIVKCSYNAVALSPNLKSQYASAQMSPVLPLRLIVPANYPNCSPVLLDKSPVELSKEFEDLSVKARLSFSSSLRVLSQPMSLGEMARTWDICVRKVVTEYAQQNGGGSFSSRYGTWEKCVSA